VAGQVERVTYHDEETGFAVLRVGAGRGGGTLTVTGRVPAVSAGEWLAAEGRWVVDRDHGRQFRADSILCSPPTSAEGIERYLGSGLVKGVGPACARRLVAAFGARVLEILDKYSSRLEEVDGIGPSRRKAIKAAWTEQKAVREIMLFLHANGVGTARATRIFKTYGESSIKTVRADPYRLARDITGIGFKTADAIASRLGIAADSPSRARAGIAHALSVAAASGHCGYPADGLAGEAEALLGVGRGMVEESLAGMVAAGDLVEDHGLVYLPQLLRAESRLATGLRALAAGAPPYPAIDPAAALEWVEKKTGVRLAPGQSDAFRMAVSSRAVVITGGPGVGKTTVMRAILMALRAKKVAPLLAAPTGRAAKRLSEATGLPATTLHRLLEARPGGTFGRGSSRPLECDVLVVDEVSMLDVPLFARVVDALPPGAALILVGDADQLPSVGPGAAMAGIIASGALPVARLGEVFRQAAESAIVTNAHRINSGGLPTDGEDFYCLFREGAEAVSRTLLEVVCRRIPKKLGLDPMEDIQVLAPMNRGPLGVRALNTLLQDALNPLRPEDASVERFGWQFRPRDKVLQTSNDYEKEVFNGDIGRVRSIDPGAGEVVVDFAGREVPYALGELDTLVPAYAITIHKSQGSEFPAVVIPLSTGHYPMLQRNLLYTGLTRARSFAVLIAEQRALRRAVTNNPASTRHSALEARLAGGPFHGAI